jgi:AcrR family transcriptional regulator
MQRRRSAVRPRADKTLLTKRRLPVQERARKSVDLILDAAVHLLDEAGLDAFNTNTLAARAGVRVRTVYRYFPNKLAVIIAVAERMAAEWDGWLAGFDELADPRSDWRRLWSDYVDRFVEGIRAAPGGIAIRRAMRALPELQAVDRRDNDHLARQLTSALQRRGVGLPRRRLKSIASLLIESAVAVLDSALLQAPGDSRALVAELKAMQVAYLEANVFASR